MPPKQKGFVEATAAWLIRRAAEVGLGTLPKEINDYIFGTDGSDVKESEMNHKWDNVLRRSTPRSDEVIEANVQQWYTLGQQVTFDLTTTGVSALNADNLYLSYTLDFNEDDAQV